MQHSENPRDDQDNEVPGDSLNCPCRGIISLGVPAAPTPNQVKPTAQEKATLGPQQVHTRGHTHFRWLQMQTGVCICSGAT